MARALVLPLGGCQEEARGRLALLRGARRILSSTCSWQPHPPIAGASSGTDESGVLGLAEERDVK